LCDVISPVQSQVGFKGIDGLLRIAEHLNGLLRLHPPDLHFFDAVPFATAELFLDVPSGAISIHIRVLDTVTFHNKLHRHPCRLPANNENDLLVDEKLSANAFDLKVFAVQQTTYRSPTPVL
jgi:hypothetical protein